MALSTVAPPRPPSQMTKISLPYLVSISISQFTTGNAPLLRVALRSYLVALGNEWLRVIQDSDEGESWGQYAEKIYNQISMAGPHHTVRSTRDSPHVHLSWAEWDGWAVELTDAKRE